MNRFRLFQLFNCHRLLLLPTHLLPTYHLFDSSSIARHVYHVHRFIFICRKIKFTCSGPFSVSFIARTILQLLCWYNFICSNIDTFQLMDWPERKCSCSFVCSRTFVANALPTLFFSFFLYSNCSNIVLDKCRAQALIGLICKDLLYFIIIIFANVY